MSYSNYNTPSSGWFNTPGQFVSAGEMHQQQNQQQQYQYQQQHQQYQQPQQQQYQQPQQQQYQTQQPQQYQKQQPQHQQYQMQKPQKQQPQHQQYQKQQPQQQQYQTQQPQQYQKQQPQHQQYQMQKPQKQQPPQQQYQKQQPQHQQYQIQKPQKQQPQQQQYQKQQPQQQQYQKQQPQQQQYQKQQPQYQQFKQQSQKQQQFGLAQEQQSSNLVSLQQESYDVEMTPVSGGGGSGGGEDRGVKKKQKQAPWTRNHILRVKRITMKERRRRQNEVVRRLLTPKNAAVLLNEMIAEDQIANRLRIEQAPAQYLTPTGNCFCADLTVDQNNYKGYGENKVLARNAAAEMAIRDLILKRMSKVLGADANSTGSQNGEAEEETLPMIQLASFALHKLFSEWEYEGHKVPQLKPTLAAAADSDWCDGGGDVGETSAGSSAGGRAGTRPGTRRRRHKVKPPKELPTEASAMHPCMLLSYMRAPVPYRELSVAGDRPEGMVYTVAVDVDGGTYVGKASNKKEARKAAATAACTALFGVTFAAPPAPAHAADVTIQPPLPPN